MFCSIYLLCALGSGTYQSVLILMLLYNVGRYFRYCYLCACYVVTCAITLRVLSRRAIARFWYMLCGKYASFNTLVATVSTLAFFLCVVKGQYPYMLRRCFAEQRLAKYNYRVPYFCLKSIDLIK